MKIYVSLNDGDRGKTNSTFHRETEAEANALVQEMYYTFLVGSPQRSLYVKITENGDKPPKTVRLTTAIPINIRKR